MYYYIAANGILAVKTNEKDFKWSFGHNIPQGTLEEYEKCKVKIQLIIEDFDEDNHLDGLGKYHYFNGDPGGKKIYYTRKLAMNKKIRIKAENLMSDEPKITFNRNYYNFITHRIMNLHSVGYIMTDLAMLLVLEKGFAPIHCSAFKKDDSVVVVFAPPGTGKTLSSMMACMDYDAQFIAEDIAITDGEKIYSVPWTSTFRFYSNMEQSTASKIKNKAVKLLPPLEYVSFSKAKPVTDYVDTSMILNSESVTHIAILERGTDEMSVQLEEEAIRKMLNLNRNAFHYLKSPFLTAYEFFNSEMDIDKAAFKEKEILTKLVKNSEMIFSLKANNPTDYAHKLVDQVKDGSLGIKPV